MADVDGDALAALAKEFAGKEEGAEAGMEQAGEVEEGAVLAAEKDREDGCAAAADEAGDGGAPADVGNFASAAIEGGDFAGREDGQSAAVFHEAHGGADGAEISRGCAFAAEGIDEEHGVADFGNDFEQMIGEHFHIGADALEDSGEDDAVEAPERVIGDDNEWAGFGN